MYRNEIDLLAQQEGLELSVYDDANGISILPGTKVIGNPTINFGRNVSKPNGFDRNIALLDLIFEIDTILKQEPWIYQLTGWRRAAVVSMRYNLGHTRFNEFVHFISAMQRMDWQQAIMQLANSKAAHELVGRYKDLEYMILNNEPPHALNIVTAEVTTFSSEFVSFLEQLRANNYEVQI